MPLLKCSSDCRLAFIALILPVLLASCGGGSHSGGNPALLRIEAEGATDVLWQEGGGPPALCPDRVFLNAQITFLFGGAVDPASLPQIGFALGSINIAELHGPAARGTFAVADDPALPAGNHRRVIFTPALPTDPAAPCDAGLTASRVYQVFVPDAGNGSAIVVVDGSPLRGSATACFETCGCADPVHCPMPFKDAAPGSPFVVSTNPGSGNPAPAGISPCSIAGNTVHILINEGLNPTTVDLSNVRIINLTTGGQVPGSVVFYQAGTLPAFGQQSQIDYVATTPLAPNTTFEIVLGPGLTDLVGKPVQVVPGNPSGHLYFATAAGSSTPLPPIVETFDTTANRGVVTGAMRWDGNGLLQAVFPLELTGTGADGAFNPATGLTVLDTNEMVGGMSRKGIWNFSAVNIPMGATVRFIGPYQAHLRCLGTVTLDGTIDVSAGALAFTSPNVFDRGPEPGLNNNSITTTVCTNGEANGGLTSAGGGQGGTASGTTALTGMQCTLRTLHGEAGFGPTIDGNLSAGGGGQGGDSGCLPFSSPLTGCALGDVGGLGGAGGSAARAGENGLPRQNNALCMPANLPPANSQPIAQAPPIPPVMVPPIAVQSAGSGGGGGGDHLEISGVNADDQGGGGGGGGGGLRISCVGAYVQGTNGTILARGATGGNAGQFAGGGGSGSGGEVWIQSFSTVTMAVGATVSVDGPPRFNPVMNGLGCSNFAAGGGGDGLVQLEAGQGPVPTAMFNLVPIPTPTNGAVFAGLVFPFGVNVTGHATSTPFDTGVAYPDYTAPTEVVNLGNAAGATLTIRYEGFAEAVNSTPQFPIIDFGSLKSMATGGGPITAANIDELDGYRFIVFVVDVSYPPPPATASTAVLPSVDQISINFGALACP